MVAWEGGAPECDITIEVHNLKDIDVATEGMKGLGKAAVAATDKTKEVARTIRRVGSVVALFDSSAGAAIFKMSRMAMTMGTIGVAIAGVTGAYHFLMEASQKQREEWNKHLSVIGRLHEKYEKWKDALRDPLKVASMERLGIGTDPEAFRIAQSTEPLYGAYDRGQKLIEAGEIAFVDSMLRLATSADEAAKRLDDINASDSFIQAVNLTDQQKEFGVSFIEDPVGWFGGLIKGWKSTFNDAIDENTTPEMYAQRKIEEIENWINYADTHNQYIQPEYRKTLEETIEALKNLDVKKLLELGRTDLAKPLEITLKMKKQNEVIRIPTLEDLLKDIDKDVKENTDSLVRLFPTGIWSVNMQGAVPYQSQKIPLSALYGERASGAQFSVPMGESGGSPSAGGATSVTNTTTATSGGNTYNITNHFHFSVEDVSEMMSAKFLRKLGEEVQSRTMSSLSGAGVSF